MKKKIERKDCVEADELMRVIRENIDSDREKAMEAFGKIYSKYCEVLWNMCVKVCGDNTIADKVYGATWKKILNHPNYVYKVHEASFETWMSTIANNAWLDILRKEIPLAWEDVLDEYVENEIGVEEDDDEVKPSFEAKLVEDALAELTEKERDILKIYVLYDTDKKKHVSEEVLNELKNRYNTTSANLRKIKSRALEKVRDYINKHQ